MQPDTSTDSPAKERIQKILARAGFGSRRACEELIVDGRVTLNGETVSVLGATADASRDTIAVDGERVRMPQFSYWIANKPEGVAVSERDAERFVQDVIPGEHPRVFTVGRLDKGSCGLMFVTNDGRVANILTHPRYKVPKSYRLTLKGEVTYATAAQIERALYYSMNAGRFERLRILKSSGSRSLVRLTAYEGLPGALRDICLKYGHSLKLMERMRIGPLDLRELLGEPGIRDRFVDHRQRADEGPAGAPGGVVRRGEPLVGLRAPVRALGREVGDVASAHARGRRRGPAVEFAGGNGRGIGDLQREVARVEVPRAPQGLGEVLIDLDSLVEGLQGGETDAEHRLRHAVARVGLPCLGGAGLFQSAHHLLKAHSRSRGL